MGLYVIRMSIATDFIVGNHYIRLNLKNYLN